jgi:hypothetical protein
VNRRTLAVVLAVGGAAAAAGCAGVLGLDETHLGSSEDASTSDSSTADGAGGDVRNDAPATIGRYQDASVAVQVSVQRNGVLPGTLSVTFTQLPTGVTSNTGTIAADAGSTTVTVKAAGSAPTRANIYAQQGTSGGGGSFNYAAAAPMGDSQDRIYMVGSGGDMFTRSAELDRVLVGGGFDPTFGTTGGQVTLDPTGAPPPFYFTLEAVAVQPDGRIVIAGSRTDTMAGTTYPVVGRFWP